jgi:hypothetical protein
MGYRDLNELQTVPQAHYPRVSFEARQKHGSNFYVDQNYFWRAFRSTQHIFHFFVVVVLFASP